MTSPPPLALLTTRAGGGVTEVDVVDEAGGARRLGEVVHASGEGPRAAVALDGSVYVEADALAAAPGANPKDKSFAGELTLLREGEPNVTLADRVVHASTPLVLADGRVLVSRGVAGVAEEGRARFDELTVDVVDPLTKEARTLASFHGSLLFIAGAVHRAKSDEVIVYRVGEEGADVAAVELSTSPSSEPAALPEPRVIASVPAFARDFSVSEIDNQLVYVDRAAEPSTAGAGAWATLSTNVETGETHELARGPFMPMIPHVVRTGNSTGIDVILTLDPERGPTLFSERDAAPRIDLGPGSMHLADQEGDWITGTVGRDTAHARVFIANLATGAVILPRTAATSDASLRVVVAGFARGER